jgi:hypothetical protein
VLPEVEDEVLLCVLESILVLLEVLGELVAELPESEPELALGVALVLGALEPPAALESLSLCFFEVEPLLDWSFLFLRSPLCLPLFVCVRPFASVDTFGLSVGPAFVVSEVVAPAPAFAPVEELAPEDIEPLVEPLVELLSLVLPVVVLVPAPAPTFAPALPLALVSVLVLWAAASWLKETASRPEKSTGKNLRIRFLQGLGSGNTEVLVANVVPALFRGFDRLIARQVGRRRRDVALVRTGIGIDRLALFRRHRRRAARSAVDARALEELLLLLLLALRLRLLLGSLLLALGERSERQGEQAGYQ